MIVLGLTGSIGMGKTTTAGLFRDRGIPVWDADAAVHRLYGAGGAAVAPLGALFPQAIRDGHVDRQVLREGIAEDPELLARIEAIVHPLVAEDRRAFLARNAPLVVLDVPLLFETGLDAQVDRIAVVSVPPEVQRDRVLARGTMSEADFETILAKQLPDREKRARADHVIDTFTPESARRDVDAILEELLP
ncbi:MAG: dephospho-CoA kinase [Pseudomonadota bacterium]